MTADFLAQHGCSNPQPLAEDGSARAYMRVNYQGKTAALMDMRALTNGTAELERFIAYAQWLRDIGLSAPQIYAYNKDIAIIEDFGDEHFISDPDYDLMLEALHTLQNAPCPLKLPTYENSMVHKGRIFLLDYYLPAALGRARTDEDLRAYNAMWEQIESTLPPQKRGTVHGDFHVENMMWLRDRLGVKRCGIIDFQDMMEGSLAYDVCNLAWDMRIDVDEATRQKILQSFDADIQAWAYVLAAQFHCRLAGQCVRWAIVTNKPQYMRFLPRIYGYLQGLLQHESLSPLKVYLDEIGLDFYAPTDLDLPRAKTLLRPDAF